MDDQFFVRILHRRADLTKEPQAVVDGELISVAILIDGRAFDVLHDQIRRTIFTAAAVEKLHDVGMVEGREGLPLIAKTMEDLFSVDSRLNHFNRNLFAIILIVALAEI